MVRICYLSKVWKNGTISDPSIELHFLCDWDSLGDSLGDSFVFFLASIEIRLGVRLEIRLDLSVATSGIRFNASLVNTYLKYHSISRRFVCRLLHTYIIRDEIRSGLLLYLDRNSYVNFTLHQLVI